MNSNTIGMRIEHLRTKHKLSQKALGEMIGVGYTAISNYERGYSTPNIDKLKQFSNVFGVKISYLTDEVSEFDEKLMQGGIITNRISYYKPANTNGIITGDTKLADSIISLPPDSITDNETYICTKANDNSMSNIGITENSYVIINKSSTPLSGDIVAVFDISSKKIIIRKYVCDGPLILLIADGQEDVQTICTSIKDNDYSIVGTIKKAIINL